MMLLSRRTLRFLMGTLELEETSGQAPERERDVLLRPKDYDSPQERLGWLLFHGHSIPKGSTGPSI